MCTDTVVSETFIELFLAFKIDLSQENIYIKTAFP